MYVILSYSNDVFKVLDTTDMSQEDIDLYTLKVLSERNIEVLGFYDNVEIGYNIVELSFFIEYKMWNNLIAVNPVDNTGKTYISANGRLFNIDISTTSDIDDDIDDNDIDDISDDTLFKKKKNKNLHKAKKAKNDEFYTQLSDIEAELSHYPVDYFKDKVIYCPTDVAVNTGSIKQSNFVKYFQMNAHRLQFKKLIATCLVEKAAGDNDTDLEKVQNCYVLERQLVDSYCRKIHSYISGERPAVPVVGEKEDLGLKYIREDGRCHNIPYHIVNQAVTEPLGRIKIAARYIDHYDTQTGRPVLGKEDKGITWKYHAIGHGIKTLKIKWVRLHPDGFEEMLPDECYFYNNILYEDVYAINDFGLFEEYTYEDGIDPNPSNHRCYETPLEDLGKGGTLCLLPSEFYDYREYNYNIEEAEYSKHCPSDITHESGDFNSDYCTNLLKEADIVVTNPPFSLFRDFFKWLMDNDKKFLILGNRAVCGLDYMIDNLKSEKVALGFLTSHHTLFAMPDSVQADLQNQLANGELQVNYGRGHDKSYSLVNGEILKSINSCWYTNIKPTIAKEVIILTKNYNCEDYPFFDDTNIISVEKTVDIPCDYDGVMGVPISFLDKYSPSQFEIVGSMIPSLNGKKLYKRILIRRKEVVK